MALADEFVAQLPRNGVDPRQSAAVPRGDTQGNRLPARAAPRERYCPSHQHLAETEDREVPALAA